MAAALDACPAAVIVTDVAGVVLWVNRLAAVWLEVDGPPRRRVWDDLGLPWRYSVEFWQSLVSGEPRMLSALTWRRPDGVVVNAQATFDAVRKSARRDQRVICYLSSFELRVLAHHCAFAGAFEWWPSEQRLKIDPPWLAANELTDVLGHGDAQAWRAAIHSADKPLFDATVAQAAAGVDDLVCSYRMVTPCGHVHWISQQARVIERTPSGAPRAVVGLLVNIDDQKARELQLDSQNARLEAALSVTGGGSWDWDLRTDVSRHSDAYYRMFGVEPSEGRRDFNFWSRRVHPADGGVLLEAVRRRLPVGQDSHEADYRIQHADGQWRWVLDRGRVVERDAEGLPARMIGMLVDITERKTQELAVTTSDQRFRAAAQAVRGIVYEIDLATGYAARVGVDRVLGYSADEIGADADSWFQLYHPDDRAQARKTFEQYLATGISQRSTFRARHRDGHYVTLWESPYLERDIAGKPVRSIGFAIDVTEQVARHEQLADSEQLFRTVAALTPGFVWQSRLDARANSVLVRVSDGFEQLVGCSLEAFERKGGWHAFLVGDSIDEARRAHARLLAGAAGVNLEVQLRRVDGTHRWVFMRAQAVRDPATEQVIGSIGSAEDVTQKRVAEEALRRSQAQLMTIAQSSADWLLLLDTEERVVFINRMLLGQTPAQLMGRTIGEIAQPGASDYMSNLVRDVLTTGRPSDSEQVYHDPKLGRRVFELRLRPVHAGDRIAGVVMNATEITRRREADELRETQARMLETLREAVAMVGSDGVIRLANASFDRLFGFATGGAIGTSLAQRFVVADAGSDAAFDKEMRDAAAQPVATRIERECTRCDGERFTASVAAAAIHLADGDHWLVTFTDVTERKQLEREILEIANREQLRFGSDLHDGLGQDLTGIALMLRGVAAQLRKEQSGVQADVEDVIALVNGAIDSTRLMARGLSPVGADRGGLIAGLEAMAARGIERYGVRTTLTTNLMEPLEVNDARATHLYRIAQEALTNAVRHGRISEVSIDLATGDGQLTLTITDNGRGLDPKFVSRGGMGLKLMRYRAQMVAGELTLTNRLEGGLIVRCVCPHRVSGDSTIRRSGGFPLKD